MILNGESIAEIDNSIYAKLECLGGNGRSG